MFQGRSMMTTVTLFPCLLLSIRPISGAFLKIKSLEPWPSSSSSELRWAVDGRFNTTWVSNACRGGYSWALYPAFNALSQACSKGYCSGSCSADLTSATDGSPYTAGSAVLSQAEGRAWASFLFPNGPIVVSRSIYIRGVWPVDTQLSGLHPDGSTTPIAVLGPSLNYLHLTYPGTGETLAGLVLQSATRDGLIRGYCFSGVGDCKTVTVTEVAVQSDDCYEQITVDFGAVKVLNNMKVKYSGFQSGSLSTSVDGLTFVTRPAALNIANVPTMVPLGEIVARYARLKLVTSTEPTKSYNKVYIQDVSFFGVDASTLTSCPNGCSSHGSCITSTHTCTCAGGYSGADCSVPPCSQPCSANGHCVAGTCVCSSGYSGSTCATSFCNNNCWGNGMCSGGTCSCFSGFSGSDCRFAVFRATNGVATIQRSILDYDMVLSGRSYVSPIGPSFDNVLQARSFGGVCTSPKSFRCIDGSCAISKGQCALRARKGLEASNPALKSLDSRWIASNFDTAALHASTIVPSSNTAAAGNACDGNSNTFWQSGTCYPTGFVSYSTMNILNGACAQGRCTYSSTSAQTVAISTPATDMNTVTSVGASLVSGSAWFQVVFPATTLSAIAIKVSYPVSIMGIVAATNQAVLISQISATFVLTNVDIFSNPALSSATFSAIKLTSNTGFTVFEIAARSITCSEFTGVDLGTAQTVTGLTVRHWAGGSSTDTTVASTLYETSLDGQVWQAVTTNALIPPHLLSALDVVIPTAPTATVARYVRVRHMLSEGVSLKVFVWEISVWGSDGKYGSVPAVPNSVSFRNLFGVNGIWSWGGQGGSNLAEDGWGPRRYSNVASHARNYHSWSWDVKDPDNIPDYEAMTCGKGTESQWWLSWDSEYAGWQAAGLEVEASIQFTSSMFSQSSFNDPYKAGYNYGYTFAKHFGRNGGVRLVASIEVGNEPWIVGMGYSDPGFYETVLLGMAHGVKAADPTMRVLPAAFGSLQDTLARLNATHIKYLDAFNIHAYSWLQTEKGRTGIYPEHNMSSIHSVNSLLRLRNELLPDMPVYLTEWGWDSAGGGEDCGPPPDRAGQLPFPECVSEKAQAFYAVRGIFVLARKGLSRLSWYFYGNLQQTGQLWDAVKGVFSRSGLVSSSSTGFQTKQALQALEQFMSTVGDRCFQSALREDASAYVYALGDCGGTNNVTHIAAWRPVDGDDASSATVSIALPYIPTSAWYLGFSNYTSAKLPTVSGSVWTMQLYSYPIVVSAIRMTSSPTHEPSPRPTLKPLLEPTPWPTTQPSFEPFHQPTHRPVPKPSASPTPQPAPQPTPRPTLQPSQQPNSQPTLKPTLKPMPRPTPQPTLQPSPQPTPQPTMRPTPQPTHRPAPKPTSQPSSRPTPRPTPQPTIQPTLVPMLEPTLRPSPRPKPRPTRPPQTSPRPATKPTSELTLQPTPTAVRIAPTLAFKVAISMAAAAPPTTSDQSTLKTTIASALRISSASIQNFVVISTQTSSRRRLLVGFIWTASFEIASGTFITAGTVVASLTSAAFITTVSESLGAIVETSSVSASPASAFASSGGGSAPSQFSVASASALAGAIAALFCVLIATATCLRHSRSLVTDLADHPEDITAAAENHDIGNISEKVIYSTTDRAVKSLDRKPPINVQDRLFTTL